MKKRFTKMEQEGLKRIANMIRAKREEATNKIEKGVHSIQTPVEKEKQLCNTPQI